MKQGEKEAIYLLVGIASGCIALELIGLAIMSLGVPVPLVIFVAILGLLTFIK